MTGAVNPIGGVPIGGGSGSFTIYTDRDYVWGPDYVDECLWQVDRTGAAAFVLQDANYNVMALVDTAGAVLQQYDYDPYGSPLAVDFLVSYGNNRLGHQGLFLDRFDADAPLPEMTVGADILCHARNRDYAPSISRWVQREALGTGGATVSAIQAGLPLALDVPRPDLSQTTVDGLNFFVALKSAPGFYTDPMGTFSFTEGLSALGVGLEVTGILLTGRGLVMRLGDYLGGQISGQQFAIEFMSDAIVGGTFWGAGKGLGWVMKWAAGGGRAALSAAQARGAWVQVNRSMSPRARAYQKQISGHDGMEYRLNGVDFDGIDAAGVLLDAKGPGYAKFVGKDGAFADWWLKSKTGGEKLKAQAARQIAAADGAPIVWHIAEEQALRAMQQLRELSGIILKHTPAQ